jgi:hypothetical protein
LNRLSLAFGLLTCPVLAQDPPLPTGPEGQQLRSFVIGRIEVKDAPRLDADLTDACWSDAPEIGPLVQVEPVEGATPAHKTVVKVLYDEKNLYFGILCFDSEPENIRATQRARDARMDPDDRIEIVIDTSGNKTQGYFFQIGAAGSRGDSLLGVSSFNKDWDTIWNAKTKITDRGWQAEIVIPFRSLAFPENGGEWGFNLMRNRRYPNEEYRWTNINQGRRFTRLSDLGLMEGLGKVDTGIGLDVVPYFSFNERRERLSFNDDWKDDPDAGADLFYRITPSLTASLTLYTDFAETENDSRQINLTRFPLFFPEKRDFFLEDSSNFTFGPSSFRRNDFLAFFSRRIGLGPDGDEVPIIIGGKITGQQGPWGIGILDVQTDEGGGVDKEKNLGVVRLNRSLAPETSVGFIGTRGRPVESGMNSLAGVDFYHRFPTFIGDQDLRIWAYTAFTNTSGSGGEGEISALEAQARGREWEWDLAGKWVTKEFNPELGFLRQAGVKQYRTNLQYNPRLDSEVYRNLQFQVETRTSFTEGNHLDEAEYEFKPFGFQTHAEDRFSVEIERNFDRITQDFDVFDNNTVPADHYWMTRYSTDLRTSEGRPVNVEVRTSYGDFFQGTSWRFNGELKWRVTPLLILGGSYNQTKARLSANEGFTARIAEGNVDFNFSPDMSLFNLIQYDNDSRSLGLQSRFRWIMTPGSDLFLVFSHTWDKDADDTFQPNIQELTAKVDYTLRF